MRRANARLLMTLGCLVAALPALGQPELVTDRPDQTESSVVVPRGSIQLESGVTYTSGGDGDDTFSFPEVLARIGVHERLELRIGFSGWTRDLESGGTAGAGDGDLGLKIHLLGEQGWRPEMALLASLSVPLGDDAYSSGHFDPAFRFSFAHTLSERLSLGYNLGVAWETTTTEATPGQMLREVLVGHGRFGLPPADADTLAAFEYTVALGIGLSARWGMFVELFGDVPLNGPGDPAHSFDGGFTYLLRENVQWDIAGGVGLSGDAEDWFVSTGISVRIP